MKHQFYIILAAITSVLASVTIYSSINMFFWNRLLDHLAQSDQGTIQTSDISSWTQDLAVAWTNDIEYYDYNSIDNGLNLVHLPAGLTVEGDIYTPGHGLWTILIIVAISCIGGYFIPQVSIRFSASPKHTGLSSEFFHTKPISRRLNIIKIQSILLAFTLMPAISALSWYIFYDRIQSSWNDISLKPQRCRYLFESFHPSHLEWLLILGIIFTIAFLMIKFRARHFIQNLPTKKRLKFQQKCPNRKCRYSVDQHIEICPECGLYWKKHLTTNVHANKPLRKRVVYIAILIALSFSAFSIFNRTARRRIWYWTTLREYHKTYLELHLAPSMPVLLKWQHDQIWIVMITAKLPDDPKYSPRLVYQINSEPLVATTTEITAAQFIELNDTKVLDLELGTNPPIYSPHPRIGTVNVLVEPNYAKGFTDMKSLSQDAKSFLEHAQQLSP